MSDYYIGQNASLRIMPAGDGGIGVAVRTPDNTINILLTIDIALALSEEINRVVEIVCTGDEA